MGASEISWTDATWSPVRGCSPVSEGCANCWAVRTVWRLLHNPLTRKRYAGLVEANDSGESVDTRPRWTGAVRTYPGALAEPLHRRKPRRIFVCPQGDLFHESVPFEFIAAVFGVMAACPQHTFQVLTKRARRMREFFAWMDRDGMPQGVMHAEAGPVLGELAPGDQLPDSFPLDEAVCSAEWPLPNVLLGVTCENQARAEERIPELLACPAAVWWVSVEPMLGAVDLTRFLKPTLVSRSGERLQHPDPRVPTTGGTWDLSRLQWVVVGGESGPGARPCNVEWIRSIVQQCHEAHVPCFVKQLGAKPIGTSIWDCPLEMALRHRSGADPAEWPADLRVQEWPELRAKEGR